ncbi:DUF2785 domain-containing protein [Streptomyces sp. NPDC056231]|uniref:DUF2785 domain-containing protein n=1 Tax=Streptomyces sp. NPDC056231 TaxID=3345755 RepID=UPI003AAA6403
MLVAAGDFKAGWVDAFERWYTAEQDLRRHDETLARLHAVAHGADLPAGFGRRPEVAPVRMLSLAAARLTAPTDHVYDQMEDDRLAWAIARVLTRTDLSEHDAVGWLEPIADRFGADRSAPRCPPTPATACAPCACSTSSPTVPTPGTTRSCQVISFPLKVDCVAHESLLAWIRSRPGWRAHGSGGTPPLRKRRRGTGSVMQWNGR